MKHLFVPYELALLAKEKGFNELCLACYSSSGEIMQDGYYSFSKPARNEGNRPEYPTAPLYQQLVDWFREKYKIHFLIKRDGGYWIFEISSFKDEETESPFEKYEYRIHATDYHTGINKTLTEAFKLI